MYYEKYIDSPIGPLTLESDGSYVTALRFGDLRKHLPSCPGLEEASVELAEYFSGTR